MKSQYSDSPSGPPLTLAFDTGSPLTSVALGRAGRPLAAREAAGGRSSASLLRLIDEVLRAVGVRLGEVDRLIVARGPGSFTGLRVGMATALGLHQTLAIPATAVDTLPVLAAAAAQPPGEETIVAVVDALRGEWFLEAWSPGRERPLAEAAIVAGEHITRWAPCRVAGFGLDRLPAAVTGHPGVEIAPAGPLAGPLLQIADRPDVEWNPATLVEPLYLRPPAAKIAGGG